MENAGHFWTYTFFSMENTGKCWTFCTLIIFSQHGQFGLRIFLYSMIQPQGCKIFLPKPLFCKPIILRYLNINSLYKSYIRREQKFQIFCVKRSFSDSWSRVFVTQRQPRLFHMMMLKLSGYKFMNFYRMHVKIIYLTKY